MVTPVVAPTTAVELFRAVRGQKPRSAARATLHAQLTRHVFDLMTAIATEAPSADNANEELTSLLHEMAKLVRRKFNNLPAHELEAADLADDVWISLMHRLERQTAIPDNPMGYLLAALRNRCLTALRKFESEKKQAVKAEARRAEEREAEAAEASELAELEDTYEVLERVVAWVQHAGGTHVTKFLLSWRQIHELVIAESSTIDEILRRDEGYKASDPAIEFHRARNRVYAQHKRFRNMLLKNLATMIGNGALTPEEAARVEKAVNGLSRRQMGGVNLVSSKVDRGVEPPHA